MAKKHRVKKASHPGQGGTQTKLPQDREPPSITIPAGRPMQEVYDAINEFNTENAPRTGTDKQPTTHHGWGRGDIPATEPHPHSASGIAHNLASEIKNAPTGAGGIPLQMPPDLPSPSGGKSPALDFSDALMRGDPRATEALARSMADAKRDKNASLADQFIADSGRQAAYWALHGKQAKLFDAMLERYRDEIRRAHRFHLD